MDGWMTFWGFSRMADLRIGPVVDDPGVIGGLRGAVFAVFASKDLSSLEGVEEFSNFVKSSVFLVLSA